MHCAVFVDLFSLLSSGHTSDIFVSVAKSEMFLIHANVDCWSLFCERAKLRFISIYLRSSSAIKDMRKPISKFEKVHSLTWREKTENGIFSKMFAWLTNKKELFDLKLNIGLRFSNSANAFCSRKNTELVLWSEISVKLSFNWNGKKAVQNLFKFSFWKW